MKLPVTIQGESNECGLACICMILNHHGRRLTMPDLRNGQSSGEKLSLENLSRVAAEQGLLSRALRCEPGDLRSLPLPAILHLDFEHFVVLAGVSRSGVQLHDPARGVVQLNWQALGQRFTGIALTCTPSPDFEPTESKLPNPIANIISKLHFGKLVPGLAGLLGLSFIAHLLTLLTPYYLQLVVDQVLLLSNAALINTLTLGFLLVYAIAAITRFLRGLLIVQLGSCLSYSLAGGLMNKLLVLPLPYFARRQIGDFTSRFSSLAPVQGFLTEGLVSLLLDGLMIFMTLTMLVVMAPTVAAAVLGITLIFLALQWLMLKPYRQYSQNQVVADARLQSQFVETVHAIEIIRRNQLQTRRSSTWANLLIETINPQIRASQWNVGIDTLRFALSGGLTLAVVHLATQEIIASALSVGALYTLVAYAGHFASAAVNCSNQWQGLAILSLHAQRLTDITDTPSDNRKPMPLVEPAGIITFTNVSFGYEAATRTNLIEQLNLTISKRQKVAITGPSGTGKSSLMSLLLGDMTPTAGEISINGQPIHSDIDPSHCMSVLHQHDQMLEGSIAENITLAEEKPDELRMIKAARTAEIHEDILRLPMGYEEKVSSQHGISNGQRQRLLIARALYRQADVLLLDEPTNHLDAETELRVMKNILKGTQICVFITHRPEIAALADIEIRLPNTHVVSHSVKHTPAEWFTR